jgi:hypothetical protein
MSYSVNFSENASGKIVLGNVVMNGNIYSPPADTEVFTKDATNGNLTKNVSLDLNVIKYTPTGTTGVASGLAAEKAEAEKKAAEEAASGLASKSVGTAGAPIVTRGTASTSVAPEEALKTAADEALTTAQTAILEAITIGEEYKTTKFPKRIGGARSRTVDAAITAVGTAIAKVDTAITAVGTAITSAELDVIKIYEEKKTQLEATKLALAKLKTVLDKFNTEPTDSEATEEKLEEAIKELTVEHNKLIELSKTKGGAPLRFGSSSSKTKRNRRRNRRFAKKSYKRRR